MTLQSEEVTSSQGASFDEGDAQSTDIPTDEISSPELILLSTTNSSSSGQSICVHPGTTSTLHGNYNPEVKDETPTTGSAIQQIQSVPSGPSQLEIESHLTPSNSSSGQSSQGAYIEKQAKDYSTSTPIDGSPEMNPPLSPITSLTEYQSHQTTTTEGHSSNLHLHCSTDSTGEDRMDTTNTVVRQRDYTEPPGQGPSTLNIQEQTPEESFHGDITPPPTFQNFSAGIFSPNVIRRHQCSMDGISNLQQQQAEDITNCPDLPETCNENPDVSERIEYPQTLTGTYEHNIKIYTN